jgi:hypothetical protein
MLVQQNLSAKRRDDVPDALLLDGKAGSALDARYLDELCVRAR